MNKNINVLKCASYIFADCNVFLYDYEALLASKADSDKVSNFSILIPLTLIANNAVDILFQAQSLQRQSYGT